MLSDFLFNTSDVSSKENKYHINVKYINDGEEHKIEASGKTPEELYKNIIKNFYKAPKYKISEKNNEPDNIDSPKLMKSESTTSSDSEDLILDYAINLEEENEELRDKVQKLEKELSTLKKKFLDEMSYSDKLYKIVKTLDEENTSLYKYICSLEKK